jgi:hypothetical protein
MSETTKEWFHKAYLSLTDDDLIAENKRKNDRKETIEDKKTDSGYIE